MKVLCLKHQGSGVGYYRFDVPLQHAGVEVAFEDLYDNSDLEDFLVKKSKEFDLIHGGYVINPDLLKTLAAVRNYASIPIITDIDDDILNVPDYNIAYKSYHGGAQGRRVARMQLRISDAVSVSTPRLQETLGPECRHAEVLPNCLVPELWEHPTNPQRKNDKHVYILFSGNIGRYGDLEQVKAPLKTIMNKHKHVRLLFKACLPDWAAAEWMTSRIDPRENRAFAIRRSQMEHYPAILRWLSPDIFIAPVYPNRFNEGKSHIKAYDAAMTGGAFVCSDWPTYASVPDNCAIKVDSETQWTEALDELVRNAGMRERLNNRLKQWALDEWHIDRHVEKWVNLYEKVHAEGPVTELDQLVRPGVR